MTFIWSSSREIWLLFTGGQTSLYSLFDGLAQFYTDLLYFFDQSYQISGEIHTWAMYCIDREAGSTKNRIHPMSRAQDGIEKCIKFGLRRLDSLI